ncbi:NACHT, LRR and PYD domains-containing protein 1b allele 3-like [Symphorus nematophorus]
MNPLDGGGGQDHLIGCSNISLQSAAGAFECSVSGLRWVCQEKVTFKYRFCSCEEPLQRMKDMDYVPAGPLMDVTVAAGRFDEVFLPHWIHIKSNPSIRDKFAVLTVDDCGDVVEKASEVTASHVKLSDPSFSMKMVLVRVGLSVGINCKVLIYKTNTAFLTLHVYLIPPDPGLQQELDKKKLSQGYEIIQKPYPEEPLTMNDRFILTADLDAAEIYPERLMLRYESRDPNFFEVFIENPNTNFKLNLRQEDERRAIWSCDIRKNEYQTTKAEETDGAPTQPGCSGTKHFVDEHQVALTEKVNNMGVILDELLHHRVLGQETYDRVRALPSSREKMRELYSGPLRAGTACKDVFHRILEENEPFLIAELRRRK